MKKIIIILALASIIIMGCIKAVNASSVELLCSQVGKIIDVTNDYVFFVATGKSPQDFLLGSSSDQKCLSYNTIYKFPRPLREIFIKDQEVFVELSRITALGPNGAVSSGEEWTFKSDDGVVRPFNISIQPEKVSQLLSDSLIEGRTYTVAELNTNTSTTSRKFFTEAYVVYASKTLPCPTGKEEVCAPPAPPYIIIYDENISSNLVRAGKDIELRIDNYGEDYFKVGKKYRFEISIHNTNKDDFPKNEFSLVFVKNIDGSAVTVQTPPSTPPNPPAKKSIFIRFVNWFLNLFW